MNQKLTITLEFTDFNKFNAFNKVLKQFENVWKNQLNSNQTSIISTTFTSEQIGKRKRGRPKKIQNITPSVNQNHNGNPHKLTVLSHQEYQIRQLIEKKFGKDILNKYINLYDNSGEKTAKMYIKILIHQNVIDANNFYNKNYKIKSRKSPENRAPFTKFNNKLIGYNTLNEAKNNKKPGESIYVCRVLLSKNNVDTHFPVKYYCVNVNNNPYSKQIPSYIRSSWCEEYNPIGNKQFEKYHKDATKRYYSTHISAKCVVK